MNLQKSIENIYNSKKNDSQKKHQREMTELEAEEKFLLFITQDIENGYRFGVKDGKKVVYKFKKILKQLNFDRTHFLFEFNCLNTLKGLALNVEEDSSNQTFIICLDE